MGFMSIIKEIIYKFDLFDSGNLLRVKGEPQYKTLIGGVVSMTVMLILITAFYNRIIDTFDKVLIYSSTSISNAFDPIPLNLSTVGSGPFMFGVEVFGLKLNQGTRYFDVQMKTYHYQNYGVDQNITEIILEACTVDHWSRYPQIQAKFDQLNMANWQCLPKNSTFEIKGAYSSQKQKTLSVSVRACTNKTNQGRLCASQQQIDQYFNHTETNFFSIYFINPLLNPDDQDYLTYYLDGTNYITFSSNYGGEGLISVEDFSISTDKTILPTSNFETVSGGIITNSAIKNVYINLDKTYAVFILFKSSTSNNITRSFEKLDDVLSYIGGLFGTVIVFFFILGSYNTYKFEVSLAGYLYRTESEEEEKIEKDYNFIYFLGHSVYSLLRLFRFRPNWQRLRRYHQIREEILKQLDVVFLIKRVSFLEKSLTFLFSGPQLKGLHLTQQPTLKEAICTRRNYRLKAKLKKEIQNLQQLKMNKCQRSNEQFSKNNSISFTGPLENSNFKHTLDGEQTTVHNYNFDSENYSSDESSEQDEKRSLISEIDDLRRDSNNTISHNIWQGIDSRLKQVIERPILQYCERKKNEDNGKGGLRQHRPETIQLSNIVPDPPFEQQYEASLNLQSAALARDMFSKLQTVKVGNEQFREENALEFNDS